ncbi:MAG: peptidase M26 [Prevotella sp.]|nr:peptidase M26 [Prevotella sp.]
MKQTNIIQRLCLFLLLMVSAMGAWAEKSVLFNSTESGKSKTVTTLTKSPVTITFDNCKTSGAGNIYELVKGTGLTISVTSGYRIREIVLEDTEGGHDYDNGGLDRIGSYSDASYSMAFVKNSGSQPDNNNIQFRNYDAPAQSFRIVGHNMSNKGQLKIRRITVVYVSEGNIRFTIPSKTIHVGEEWRFAYGSITASTSGFTNSEITHSVGNNEIATCKSINGGSTCAVQGLKVGETKLNVKAGTNSNATAAYASIPLYVVRNDLSLTPSYTSKTMKAWETLDIAYPMNRPNDYNPTLNDAGVSVVSSDESVVKYDTSLQKLVFGGTGYGKTADVTVTFPQTEKYNEVSYTFQVTVDNEMRIASKDDWQAFANQMEAGNTSINATMTADVDLQTDVIKVGNVYHPFTGTFDGDGHTLSLNWNISNDEAAPFLYTSGGATIKNLHTKGQITTDYSRTSGLIARVVGKTTISRCISEVDITSSYAISACQASGLVSLNLLRKGDLTITDCIVKGTFNGTTEKGRKGMGGFVYNQNAVCTISNSLYLGSNNGGDGSDTFAKNATITNCYYLNPCGTAQGTQVTADQLKSGEVAYLLQGDRTDQFWGQMLGTEDEPQFTADAAKHIYKVDFTYNDKVVASRYANTGKTVTLPTLQDILGDSYNAHHYYSGLAFADGFTASTRVTADKTVAVAATLTDKEYFEIATADDWKAFCDLVNGGQITVDAKLTKNIDLGSNVWMIGKNGKPYSGTFDGDGHTLSIDWNVISEAAPFFYTSGGATIKNLHTKGKITTTSKGASGLIDRVVGKTTISRCISEVDITSSYAISACQASGLVSFNKSKMGDLTITDCIVKGTFNATTEKGSTGMGGFVSYNNEVVCTISNSLYLGSNNGGDWSYTFAYNATINNCYYLNPCGKAQGTQVTEKQLKNGYVTKLLQADRTDACYWAQQLGEMPSLFNGNTWAVNRIYYDTVDQRWECNELNTSGYLSVGMDFYALRTRFNRTITANKPYTVTLPCEWSNSKDKVYVLSSVNKEKGMASFSQVENNVNGEFHYFEAYKPYLVVPTNKQSFIGSSNKCLVYAEPDTPVAEDVNGVQWCATYEGLTNAEAAAAGAYILQSDGLFHKVTTDNTAAVIPPYRAYITLSSENQASGAKQLSISLGGETTGIRAIETTDQDGTVRYYDLQGRYIGNTLDGQPKGIYIKNGKKVINQ